jgi:hypothetical protein
MNGARLMKWCMFVIPALRKQRQESHAFQASLGYVERPCLKKEKKKKRKKNRRWMEPMLASCGQ